MTNPMTEHYEYDEASDTLDVYFDEKRPAWTIELTDNILISVDRQAGKGHGGPHPQFATAARRDPYPAGRLRRFAFGTTAAASPSAPSTR